MKCERRNLKHNRFRFEIKRVVVVVVVVVVVRVYNYGLLQTYSVSRITAQDICLSDLYLWIQEVPGSNLNQYLISA